MIYTIRFKVVLILFCIQVYVNSYSMTLISKESREDSVEQKRSGFIYFPIIYYSPETRMAFGSAVGHYFREAGSSATTRPSTVTPMVIYTQNKQIVTQLETNIYLKNEIYHLYGNFSFLKFPDKFYGIGNNTLEENEENFTPQSTIFYISAQKQVKRDIFAGINYQYGHTQFKKIEDSAQLAAGNILGSAGGQISGVGISADFDTRNNIFYPSSGYFYQTSVRFYDEIVGSDYNYSQYNVDIRYYFSFIKSHILAFQSYLNMISGEPSFQYLSLLGGDKMMRGYYTGRYRDKNMLAFQTEYRSPMWWRFGLACFAGFGDVADKTENFRLNKLKYSVGWGIRYVFNVQEKINLRLDFGYTENSSGFYINIGEAF